MNIGTIGHVDHGKTTLTAAITRVCYFPFRWPSSALRYLSELFFWLLAAIN